MVGPGYPVQFSVDYPARPLDRLTSAFRIFMVIPIAIVLGSVSASTWSSGNRGNGYAIAAGAGGFLFFGPLLMILFRQKYPRWWFDWNKELLRFTARVTAYFLLMDDRYPSTDGGEAHLTPTGSAARRPHGGSGAPRSPRLGGAASCPPCDRGRSAAGHRSRSAPAGCGRCPAMRRRRSRPVRG